MAKYSTVGIFEQDLDKMNLLALVTDKEQTLLMHELLVKIEQLILDCILYASKNGKPTTKYQLFLEQRGLTLEMNLVPKATVQTKHCKPIVARFSKEGDFKEVVEP